jgi:UDP-N-acetylglucosamine 3-dehydrogenase
LPEQLAVGVIGTGRMGAFHVNAYRRLDSVHLTAVADPDERARADALRGDRVAEYADWRAMLEHEASRLDAVSIACPSELHAEVALATIETGLDVLVEKPIATTLPDALRLRGAARQAGRKLMVGHVERFNPVVRTLQDALAEERIGSVLRADAVRVGPLPARIRGAGVAIDLATHDLDLLQHLLGRQVSEVYADGGRFMHPSQEDMLACLARFDGEEGGDGVLGVIDVNWLTPESRRELSLVGDRGLLRVRYTEQAVDFVEAGAQCPVALPVERHEPLLSELGAFARCLLDDTPEPVSAHDGVRALAAALAIRESAAVRRPVTLLDIPAPVPALEAVA